MKAQEARNISNASQQTFDEQSYQYVMANIQAAANEGKYRIQIASNLVGHGVKGRLVQDGYAVVVERRIDGNTIIAWD